VNQDPSSKQATCVYNCLGDVQLFGAMQALDTQLPYFAAVAVNWNDVGAKGLNFDFRLIPDICPGCTGDINCRVWDLWQSFYIGTFTNAFTVPNMEPHASNAYKFMCYKA